MLICSAHSSPSVILSLMLTTHYSLSLARLQRPLFFLLVGDALKGGGHHGDEQVEHEDTNEEGEEEPQDGHLVGGDN